MGSNLPQTHSDTRQADMLNFIALGTSRVVPVVTLAFTVLAAFNNQIPSAALYAASLIPQAELIWLNGRHLRAYGPDEQETPERARQRCRDALKRIAAPVVVLAVACTLATAAEPDAKPASLPKPVLKP